MVKNTIILIVSISGINKFPRSYLFLVLFTNLLFWENWAILFRKANSQSKYLHYVPLHFSFILSIDNSISSQNFAQIFGLVLHFSRLTKFQRIKFVRKLSPRWRHFNSFDLNFFIFFEIDRSDTYLGFKNLHLEIRIFYK